MQKFIYKDSGVNIELGDTISEILYNAAKLTWENRRGKLGDVIVPFDDFSGVRVIDVSNLPANSVMSIGFDGVGTKIELAEAISTQYRYLQSQDHLCPEKPSERLGTSSSCD